MNLLIALGHRKPFPAADRNQIELRNLFLLGIVFFCALALRDKRDPSSIGRPLRLGIIAGLRELGQPAVAIVAIKPQVSAKDALIPIRPLRVNHN